MLGTPFIISNPQNRSFGGPGCLVLLVVLVARNGPAEFQNWHSMQKTLYTMYYILHTLYTIYIHTIHGYILYVIPYLHTNPYTLYYAILYCIIM